MNVSPDALKAFIDGALPPEDAAGVAAAIEADPELAAYVRDQKRWKHVLASPAAMWACRAFDRASARGSDFILAGTMAVGIALGAALAGSYGIGTDLRADGGSLVAQGELARILSSALQSEQQENAAAHIGASFWSTKGAFCRSFATRGDSEGALAGIACRENGAWRIPAIAATTPAEGGGSEADFADLPATIRNAMENLMVGDVLTEDAEREARAQGWRVR